jgi:hypothetical protein
MTEIARGQRAGLLIYSKKIFFSKHKMIARTTTAALIAYGSENPPELRRRNATI